MTIGLSHVALGGALFACVAGIGGLAGGIRMGTAMEQAAQKRADDAAEKVRAALQGDIDASAEQHQLAEHARQSSVREIIRESQIVTERPIYSAVCVDADGVGLLDRAASTANGEGLTAAVSIAIPAATGGAD